MARITKDRRSAVEAVLPGVFTGMHAAPLPLQLAVLAFVEKNLSNSQPSVSGSPRGHSNAASPVGVSSRRSDAMFASHNGTRRGSGSSPEVAELATGKHVQIGKRF